MNLLPTDILATICGDFLFLKDFVRLDSAICNRALRSRFLSAMPLLTLPQVQNRLYGGRYDGEVHTHCLIRRNIPIRNIQVDAIGRDKNCICSFLSYNSHYLKWLQSFAWDHANDRDIKGFCEFLQLCPSLRHIHIQSCQDDLSLLVDCISQNFPRVETLGIRCSAHGGVGNAAVEGLLLRCTQLKSVVMWQCRIPFVSAQRLYASDIEFLIADCSY